MESSQLLRLVGEREQILPVLGLLQRAPACAQLIERDESLPERDLLEAADLEALPHLDGLDEVARLQQRVGRASVEPRRSAAEQLERQRAGFHIDPIEIGDLELAARRRLEPLCDR